MLARKFVEIKIMLILPIQDHEPETEIPRNTKEQVSRKGKADLYLFLFALLLLAFIAALFWIFF